MSLFLVVICGLSAALIDASADRSSHGVDSCVEHADADLEASVSLLQTGKTNLATASLERQSQPWDEHLYLVGVYHKAGSQVLRNIMRKTFDELGATSSCRECAGGNSVLTTEGSNHMVGLLPEANVCDEGYPSSIHWNNCNLSPDALTRDRILAGEAGMRAVRIIRDPLEMVASAYCYHHAGNEMPGSPFAPENIMELGAEEGVPEVAVRMMHAIEPMVMANRIAFSNDTFTVRYEDITRSSTDFDAAVSEMFDFLFGNSITPQEREEIEMLARTEDLNSEYYDGASGDEHVSSDDCKDQAHEALPLMNATLYRTYQAFRTELGYE